MVKAQFRLEALNKGEIISKVYSKSRLPKNVPKCDVIRLTARNSKGKFVDCFVYPQEAVLLSAALLRAYVYCIQKGIDKIKPPRNDLGF